MKKNLKTTPSKVVPPTSSFNKLLLPALIIITVIIYSGSLKNEFTNWDDDSYITQNSDIQTFHGDSIAYTLKKTFSSYVRGNYHPLTMLSYCLEYEKYHFNPQGYHFTNLAIHLLNTILVFYFIWLLTGLVPLPGGKQAGQPVGHAWVAFITALLFAIHPMHVESVAWVSERKDVLYSFFYLAALCTYTLYLKKEKWKRYLYAATFVLFILAVLSKAVAVNLPLAFFVLDYFLGRKVSYKTVLEKTPFLLVSYVFGYVAIRAQNSIGSITGMPHYNIFDRFLFVCYALIMYLWKLFVPVNLSCLYSYPVKQPSGLFPEVKMYPLIFYLAPIIILAIAVFIYRLKRFRKEVLFGAAFFLITMAMVLQILPVGYAIMADRYSYLPYIGLFFILARVLTYWWENKSAKYSALKMPSKVAFALFLAACCYFTVQRCDVWHDSLTLWSNTIRFDPNCALAYNSHGNAYMVLGQNQEAIKDYDVAIHLKPNYAMAYNNRGTAYLNLHRSDEAVKDFTSAIQFEPGFAEAYYNRGNFYRHLGKNKEATIDFTSAIRLQPDYALAYNNRGNAYYMLHQYEKAVNDYDTTLLLTPNVATVYNNRFMAYYALREYQLALADALKARQLGCIIDPAYITSIQANLKKTVQ